MQFLYLHFKHPNILHTWDELSRSNFLLGSKKNAISKIAFLNLNIFIASRSLVWILLHVEKAFLNLIFETIKVKTSWKFFCPILIMSDYVLSLISENLSATNFHLSPFSIIEINFISSCQITFLSANMGNNRNVIK